MILQEKYNYIIEYFSKIMPDAQTELHYNSPFQLMVAVILSAQCTDKRVNLITPALFEKYGNAESLAKAEFDEVFPFVASCSYPNNKTNHIINMSKMLIDDFNGEVPSDINLMMKLPGVGRKTANVIASVVFGHQTMPVDTHVKRVSQRIGLVPKTKSLLQVEQHLIKNLPKNKISLAHHWLILHGRYVCKARNPQCINCGITKVCDFYRKNVKTN